MAKLIPSTYDVIFRIEANDDLDYVVIRDGAMFASVVWDSGSFKSDPYELHRATYANANAAIRDLLRFCWDDYCGDDPSLEIGDFVRVE